MGDNLLMGVLDIANISIQWRIHCARCAVPLKRMEYINSGVLLMNLKELRIANLKDIWLKLAFTQKLPYLDQSILNYTCEGRIGFLPLKFNYNDLWKTQLTITLKEGLFSQEEFNEANKNPVIYHYWGKFKPWREHEMSSADIWWKYAKMTAIL
jgi:lipopolysaccharide biosynthesis glycosyltransferase